MMGPLLLTLACATSPEPKAMVPASTPTSFASLDPAALEARMKSLLRADEQLAVAPVAGAVGSSPDCGVAAVYQGPRREIGLVLACEDRVVRSGSLQTWAGDEVSATLLADADQDGHAEVVVIASWMSGMGPEGAEPFQANSILRWNGNTLEHVPDAEARIHDLVDLEQVRAALK